MAATAPLRATVVVAAIVAVNAYSQTPGVESAFEAASVKIAQPDAGDGAPIGPHGGPGTADPGFYTCNRCSLVMLTASAYGVDLYSQIRMPASAEPTRQLFNVTAKVPPGATRDQLHAMLRVLLSERFKLRAHRETAQVRGYELSVGPGARKLHESVTPAVEAAEGGKPGLDRDGFLAIPGCNGCVTRAPDGMARARYQQTSITEFSRKLAGLLGAPVADATGLAGVYDFTLTWTFGAGSPLGTAPPGAETADTLPLDAAIRTQLGLRLTEKTIPAEDVIVDHVEALAANN